MKPFKSAWFWLPPIVFLALVISVWTFRIDDTYISLRYADNLANGWGPVFNRGERVEGYTNFLLVLLEAVVLKLGIRGVEPIRVILTLCGLVTVLAVELFAWWHHESALVTILAGLLVATSAPLVLWTAGGLETTLFTMLLTLGVGLEATWLEGNLPERRCPLIGLLFFLAFLARPDGLVVYAVVLVFEIVWFFRRRSYWGLFGNLGTFLLPAAFYIVWKIAFYGRVLPSAFYSKVPESNFLDTFIEGLRKLLSFLVLDLNILIVLAIIAGISARYLIRPSKATRRSRTKKTVIRRNGWTHFPLYFALAAAVSYAAYLAFLGFQGFMDDAYRLYVPLVPLMTLALILAWKSVFFLQKNAVALLVGSAMIAVITVRGFDLWWMWHKDLNFGLYDYCLAGKNVTQGLQTGHISAGLWLKQIAEPDDVIVLHDAGAIPYYSQLTTIDLWSLNDWQMVQLREKLGRAKSDTEKQQIYTAMRDYVLSREPDFIVQDDIGLRKDPAVRAKYSKVGPTFTYVDPVLRKNDRKAFASCQPTSSYVISIWQRVN